MTPNRGLEMPDLIITDSDLDFGDPGPKTNWADWLAAQDDKTSFARPDWHGGFNKGDNRFDFAGAVLDNVSIFNAFAESIDFRGATFRNVVIEEGDFSMGNFDGCTFMSTRFNKTILTRANFAGATFRNCNLNRANLTGANFDVKEITETVVYGISAWDLEVGENSQQSKLAIEPSYQLFSEIIAEGTIPMMVDDIEMAQFVYYLTNHKKLRNTLDIFHQKGVLLLGRFKDGGIDRLYHLRDWFSDQNYLPMIFDFTRPEAMNYTETVLTMGGLSRFIVADLSGASVPHELATILGKFKNKPTICYTQDRAYSMLDDLSDDIQVIEFDGSMGDLTAQLDDALDVADAAHLRIVQKIAEKEARKR